MKYIRRSGVFIVNFEHISHLVLVFLLLTLSRQLLTGKDIGTCLQKIKDLESINIFKSNNKP